MTDETRCYVCRSGTMRPSTIRYCSLAEETPILFENVPASVCDTCGEATITGVVMGELERLISERPDPTRTITIPVYHLASCATSVLKATEQGVA